MRLRYSLIAILLFESSTFGPVPTTSQSPGLTALLAPSSRQQ
jgi:hypothetical protein